MFPHQSSLTDAKVSAASSPSAQDLRFQHTLRAPPVPIGTSLPGRAVDSYTYTQSNYDSSITNVMPSDGRYLYHPHPAMAYEYGSYPPATYDPAHYPPNQPPPSQRQMPPPNYHPQYPSAPPPHYGLPPQHWAPEAWPHYAYPQPPPPLVQDHNLSSGSTRPEMGSSVPVDPTRYPPAPPTRPSESSISGANQPLPNPQPASSQDRAKLQANESSSLTPPASSTIDFMKILDSYRLIIDSSGPFANDTPGRPPPEVMDRMLASASLSFRMMETALKEADSRKLENGVSSEQNVKSSGNSTTPAAPTTVKPSDPPQAHEGQTCLGCKATSTPEWRRGPMGPRTLCNACGLVYAKLIKKRGREARAARANGKPSSKTDADNMNDFALLSGEDGGSDDEDDDEEFSADDG